MPARLDYVHAMSNCLKVFFQEVQLQHILRAEHVLTHHPEYSQPDMCSWQSCQGFLQNWDQALTWQLTPLANVDQYTSLSPKVSWDLCCVWRTSFGNLTCIVSMMCFSLHVCVRGAHLFLFIKRSLLDIAYAAFL